MALDLIDPLIPDAQKNRSSDIFLQGIGQGLAGMARFQQMKRDSEMEMLKLAEHERLSQEQNALEKEKMANDYEIRSTALESTVKLQDAQAGLFKERARAFADGTATAAQRSIAFNQQREALVNDVNQQASKLQLDDVNFATKEPVKFAANVMQFEDMFSLAPLPEVKNAIRRYRTVADQQKIPLKLGATFDADNEKWVGGTSKLVPIWQVVRNMQDPLQQEETMAALQASGHTKVVEEWLDFSGTKVKGTRTEPSPQIKSALEQGKGVKFEHAPSRVTPAMLPKSAAGGTTPTELPDPDLPPMDEPQARNAPKFDTTQTDLYIQHAKAAIAKGAPAAAVAARLQELGIDPTPVFEA